MVDRALLGWKRRAVPCVRVRGRGTNGGGILGGGVWMGGKRRIKKVVVEMW